MGDSVKERLTRVEEGIKYLVQAEKAREARQAVADKANNDRCATHAKWTARIQTKVSRLEKAYCASAGVLALSTFLFKEEIKAAVKTILGR